MSGLPNWRLAESEKYLATYDAACSLAVFVEHIEAGYPPTHGDILVEDAKRKLRELAKMEDGNDFFTRFERVG